MRVINSSCNKEDCSSKYIKQARNGKICVHLGHKYKMLGRIQIVGLLFLVLACQFSLGKIETQALGNGGLSLSGGNGVGINGLSGQNGFDDLKSSIEKFLKGMNDTLKGMDAALKNNAFENFIKGLNSTLKNGAFENFMKGINSTLKNNPLEDFLKGLNNTINNSALENLFKGLNSTLNNNVFENFLKGINDTIKGLNDAVEKVKAGLNNTLANLGGDLKRVDNLKDKIEKFIKGRLNDTLKDDIFDQIKNVTNALKKINQTIGDSDLIKRPLKSLDKDILLAGKSGVIKIADSANQFTILRFRRLIDSDGQKAKDFEDAEWSWTAPQDVLINGLKAKNFSATLRNTIGTASVQLSVHAIVFAESGTVDYAGQKVEVYPGAVKVSYLVDKWPFKSTNSSLFYSVTISSSGKGVSNSNSTLTVGNGLFNMPSFAILDGQVKGIKIRYLVDEDSDNGTQSGVIFEFPYFSQSLYYDPVSSLKTESAVLTSNSAAFIQNPLVIVFAALFAVLFGIVM
jgi:hypothetical protein